MLDCEKNWKERVKESYRENSMLYKFYLWLKKIERRKENENKNTR